MPSVPTWILTGAFIAGAASACGGKTVIDGDGSGGSTSSGNGTGGATNGPSSGSGSGSGNGVGPGSGSTGPGNPVGPGSVGAGPMPTCDDLTQTLTSLLADLAKCDACDDGPNPCAYTSGVQLTDVCGCPVAINVTNSDLVQEALARYEEWRDTGCGPLDCDTPCAVSSDPQCYSVGNCSGTCNP